MIRNIVQLLDAKDGYRAVFAETGIRGNTYTKIVVAWGVIQNVLEEDDADLQAADYPTGGFSSAEPMTLQGGFLDSAADIHNFLGVATPDMGPEEIRECFGDDARDFFDRQQSDAEAKQFMDSLQTDDETDDPEDEGNSSTH